MPSVGPLELAVVLIIALVVFGPKRLPELGKSLGSGMREFKSSVTGKSSDSIDEDSSMDSASEVTAVPVATRTD